MGAGKDPFFGRHALVDRLTKSTQNGPPLGFVIVGARMTGKSALLRHLHSQFQRADRPARPLPTSALKQVPAYLDCSLLAGPDELWPRLCMVTQQEPSGVEPVAPNHNSPRDWCHALLTAVQKQRQQGRRLILLLDNIDHLLATAPAASELCTLLSLLNSATPLILTTQKPLYDLNRSLANSRLVAETTQLFLGLMEAEAAEQWLAYHLGRNEMARDIQSSLLTSSGRHPYLLHKVGECLAEMEPVLPSDRVWRAEHLPFLRLRLAEHGRPLFLAQWELFTKPPPGIAADGVALLVERLRQGPLPVDETPGSWLPALNWLINQALVTYCWDESGPAYAFFSPLLLDFLAYMSPIMTGAPSPAPTAKVDPAVYQDLTKIEATLLRYFEQHSQRVVSTDQLLADVWRRPNASTRRVQEAIRRLRIQLEQQTPAIGEIKNERGRGYRFVPAQTTHSAR
jgi:hypothetical protein